MQIAHKCALCEIYQFPQSPLLFGTARPLTSNLEWPMLIWLLLAFRRNNQNDIWTQVYVGMKEIFIKIRRTPANIRINLISPATIVHAEHLCC